MRFTMKIPCETCPFRKSNGIRLTQARAKSIAKMMASANGGTFPCHETVKDDDDGIASPNEIHCAGALICAEKQRNATQMMRIAERLGIYDAQALMQDNPAADDVFGSVKEMVVSLAIFKHYAKKETEVKEFEKKGRIKNGNSR